MDDSESIAAAEATTAEAVRADVPCRRCGYNLRGLSATGNCPECAQAIDASLAPDELQYLDADWLRDVRSGLRIGMLAYALLAISCGLQLLTLTVSDFGQIPNEGSRLFGIAIAGSVLLLVFGMLRSTPAEPHLEKIPHVRRIRRSVRLAAVVIGLVTILHAPLSAVPLIDLINETGLLNPLLLMIAPYIAFGLICTAYPMWLGQLLQRASTAAPTASVAVATWLGAAIMLLLLACAVARPSGWAAVSRYTASLFLPLGFAFFPALYMALWRCADAVGYDERMSRRRATREWRK